MDLRACGGPHAFLPLVATNQEACPVSTVETLTLDDLRKHHTD